MPRFLYRTLLLPLLLTVMTTMTYAGNDHDDDGGIHSDAPCGTTWMNSVDRQELLANTARLDPALYRMMIAGNKQQKPRTMNVSDDPTWIFYVTNRVTKKYDSVFGVLKWEGERARIWVDRLDTGNAAVKSAILKLARGLDTATGATSRDPNKGIIQNDEDVFGPVPTKYAADWDNKTNFILTDIKDGYTGGFVGGYFSSSDQLDQPGSNRMNLLYIDSHEGLQGGASAITALLGTLAHEFQHLIHYARNPQSETVFNEGCSEEASILLGYKDRTNPNYLANTNVDLFRWSYNDVNLLLADYERAMTLLHYLREQYGESFLTEFAKSKVAGINRINDALAKLGSSSNANEALKGFAVANYLQSYANDSRYGYTVKLGSSAKAVRTYTGSTFPSDTTMVLAPYGSSYLVFNKPQGALKFSFTSGRAFRVMAMLYSGSQVNIADLGPAQDYTLGEWGAFDKVVLAFVGLDNVQAQVAMKAEHITLGVDEKAGSIASLALLGSIPNPSAGSTVIRFTTDAAGPVTLKVYNVRGEVVRTLIDGERLSPGDHSVPFGTEDLTSGYYVTRLIQGEHSVSRPLIVTK
jgi:hypothetical protein